MTTRKPRIALACAFLFLVNAASAQDLSDLKVEKIAVGMRYTEAPAWSPDGFLLFADTVTNQIHKFTPGKGLSDFADRPGGPMGLAYDAQGRLYTCEFRERRVTRVDKKGKGEVVAERFEGKRFNAPNDIVVRHDGHVWFTDPAFGNQQDHRELDFYGVFHVSPKGEIEALAKLKTRPNGVALNPAGKILYVADSDARLIRAWDIDKNGAASNPRVFVDKIAGVPDGVRTDEKGNVYVAAKMVYIYTPEAKFIREIELAETPTNLCFGDADLETLFVTARTVVYRIRMGVKGAQY
jgi:gluconolactonase